MFENISERKHSIIFTWLLSYALVLIIPFFAAGIIYIKTEKALEEEIMLSNFQIMKRVQQQMDGLLQNVEKVSIDAASNYRISQLIKPDGNPEALNAYTTYQIVKDLNQFNLAESSITDFYIFFKDIDLVISPYTAASSKEFHDIYISGTGMPYRQWHELMSGSYRGDYLLLKNMKEKLHDRALVFIRTIPVINRGSRSASILIKLDVSAILRDTGDVNLLNTGSILIINSEGEILASTGNTTLSSGLKYSDLPENSGILDIRSGGENSVASYITSQKTGWKYVTLIPKKLFWAKVQYVSKLAVASLALCLLAGGAIVWLFLKRNYKPLVNLIGLLEKAQEMHFTKKSNEYQFIQQAIYNSINEKKKTDSMLVQQNNALRSGFLARLLKGREGGKIPINELLNRFNINFESEDFAVISFYIEGLFEFNGLKTRIKPGEANTAEELKLLQFVITNVVEELVGQKNLGFTTDIDDMVVCLINFRNGNAEYGKAEMARIAQETRDFISEYYKISVSASFSRLHKTVAAIPEAFLEAQEAMDFIRILGVKEIAGYDDIASIPEVDYYYPIEVEQQLLNFIKTSDYENARLLIDEIFERNFQNTTQSTNNARCIVFNFISTMIKTMNAIGVDEKAEFLKNRNPVEVLLQCRNIGQVKSELLELLSVFCEYISNRKKENSRNSECQLKEDVIRYIADNYYDMDLGIAGIADQFKVNPVYLSKVFKEQTGEGLLDYINKYRIEKAKYLMKDSNFNIYAAALEVGYCNTRTFTRAFKKFEGVTPGKYKEACLN